MSRTVNKVNLIKLVKAMPALWDRSCKRYYDRDLKPAMWEDIGDKLKVDPEIAKKAWENIRDTFRKKMRAAAIVESVSEPSADSSDAKWPYYFDMLDFLKDYATRQHWKKARNQPPQALLTIDSSSVSNQDGEDYEMTDYIQFYDEDYEDPLQADNLLSLKNECVAGADSVASNLSEVENNPTSPCSSENRTKRKRKNSESEDQRHIMEPEVKMRLSAAAGEDHSRSRKSLYDDDDYNFLISLLGPMKELDTLQKMRARMGMLECVTKELEKNRKNDDSKGYSNPGPSS